MATATEQPTPVALGFHSLPFELANSMGSAKTIHHIFAKTSAPSQLVLNYLPPFSSERRLRLILGKLLPSQIIQNVDVQRDSATITFETLSDPLEAILANWPTRKLPKFPEQTPEDVAQAFQSSSSSKPKSLSNKAKRKAKKEAQEDPQTQKLAAIAESLTNPPKAKLTKEEKSWIPVIRGGRKGRSETLIDTQRTSGMDVEFARGKPSVGIISRPRLAKLQDISAEDTEMQVDGAEAINLQQKTGKGRKKKNKSIGLTDFYLTREDKRKQQATSTLQAKFEQDKDVIMKMKTSRSDRKYKPY